ncbi:MAG: hypothetical protein ACL93V_16180 [Candidatus Electrothrix sp. YB6]
MKKTKKIRRRFVQTAAWCCSFLLLAAPLAAQEQKNTLSPAQLQKQRMEMMQKIMQAKMRRSGGTGWTPTAWQQTLPAIKIKEGETAKEYSFTELIKADGYLCPGSARAYKALQVALPLLYPDEVPVKADLEITYGASVCTEMVYIYFMQGATTPEHLVFDKSIQNRIISVRRISTGKKVTITFAPSGVRGHHPAAAQAGDVILRARENNGMTVRVEG